MKSAKQEHRRVSESRRPPRREDETRVPAGGARDRRRRRRRRSAARSARPSSRCSASRSAWACARQGRHRRDVAPGKIVPSGRTKMIQPFETGVVRAIHVRDGQTVKAGDVLIELDPTMNGAERGASSRAISSPPSSTSRGCSAALRARTIRSPLSSPPQGASAAADRDAAPAS